MAASVSTLVVSWKEAADRKESVAREALVIPSSRRVQVGSFSSLAVLVDLAGVDAGLNGGLGVLKLEEVDGGAGEQLGIAGLLNADLAHHLAA